MNGRKLVNKFSIYIIFLICIKLCGQNLRVIYNYRYHIDTLNIDKEDSENMILDIEKTKSVFLSYPRFVHDSLMSNRNSRSNDYQYPLEMDKSKIKDLIVKNYNSSKISLYTQIGPQTYKITDEVDIKWDISNETKILNGIKVQRATTNFVGRKWTAWFSNDYPIQDGPYKFRDLPGLILELYDNEKHHHFTMISLKNNNFTVSNVLESAKDITASKFAQLWKDYVFNPSKYYVSSASGSGYGMSVTMDGKSYSEVELLREIDKREKEKLKKINNHLDLELYNINKK